jgi:AcrR family transcriptional regulator
MTRLPMEERRERFIAAAITVVANEGVARATTRRIAEVANVPLAGLHYCFETKEQLFEAVVEASTKVGTDWAGRRVKSGMGLRAAVEVILKGHLQWILENRNMVQAQFELTHWALRHPEYEHLATREIRAYIDTTSQLLHKARQKHETEIDLEILAQHLIALVDGYAMQSLALKNGPSGAAVEYGILALQEAIAAEAPKSKTARSRESV